MQRVTTLGLISGLLLSSSLLFTGEPSPHHQQPPSGQSASLSPGYGHLHLHFEENRGQYPEAVRFIHRNPGYTLFLTKGEATTVFHTGPSSKQTTRNVLRQSLIGANTQPVLQGQAPTNGKSHYFKGTDPEAWITNAAHFAKVRYSEVYPGIDLVFHGDQGGLEYDFQLAAGSDPEAIRIRLEGADSLELDRSGNLVVQVGPHRTVQKAPLIFQDLPEGRHSIEGRFRIFDKDQVGFEIGDYDRKRALIIDPLVFVYSTYLGGSDRDQGNGIAVDDQGQAYVTGNTISADFPVEGALKTQVEAFDVFVAKLSADGSSLLFSTFLGGTGSDTSEDIAVDAAGNIYVTGIPSTTFPTTPGAFDTSPSGPTDAFVTKIVADGSALAYSTRLGGSRNEEPSGIALDDQGNAYVTGFTSSEDFPVNGFQETFGGNVDAFVSKINADGTALTYSTYLGGSTTGAVGADRGRGIAVDASGSVFVTGRTGSTDFPTTAGAFRESLTAVADVFVTKLTPDGQGLAYSTLIGSSNLDDGRAIDVDSAGNAYVTGLAGDDDFPVRNPIQSEPASNMDESFVLKLNSTGSDLVYSTFLGGSGNDRANSIAVDGERNAVIVGTTFSSDFPILDPLPGSVDMVDTSKVFITKINSTGSGLVYSTFLGGSGTESADGQGQVAVDSDGSAYVAGLTDSEDFPRQGALQDQFGGGDFDAFVTKISEEFTVFFAQFANGGDFVSEVVLTNPSLGNTLSGRLETTDDDGAPLNLNVATSGGTQVEIQGNVVSFSLSRTGSITISTDGQGPVISGAAKVVSNGSFGGVVRFTFPGIGTTGVAGSQALTGFIAPVRRTLDGINTGVAIQNTSDSSLLLDLTLLDQQGVEQDTTQIVAFPPGGHVARFIDELFPGTANDFQGSILVRATGGLIAATALELGPVAGQFTTLPVTAVN